MAELRQWEDMPGGAIHAHLRIERDDARRMSREQWEMVSDAIWLIEAALRGDVEGPLTLPRMKLPVRS